MRPAGMGAPDIRAAGAAGARSPPAPSPVALHDQGLFPWDAFRDRLIAAIAEADCRAGRAGSGRCLFRFNKYSVQVGQQPALVPGRDPSANAPLKAFDRALARSPGSESGMNMPNPCPGNRGRYTARVSPAQL